MFRTRDGGIALGANHPPSLFLSDGMAVVGVNVPRHLKGGFLNPSCRVLGCFSLGDNNYKRY